MEHRLERLLPQRQFRVSQGSNRTGPGILLHLCSEPAPFAESFGRPNEPRSHQNAVRERPASLNLICGRRGCGSERDTGSGSYPELLCLRSGSSSVITWSLFDRRSRSPSVSFMIGPVRFPVQRHPQTHWHSTPPPTPGHDVTNVRHSRPLLLRFILLLLQDLIAVPTIIAPYRPGVHTLARQETTQPRHSFVLLVYSEVFIILGSL